MKNRTLQVVREGAEDIRTMRVRGATRLALHAARVLCRAAELEGREAEEKDIQDAAVILLNSRPTAISLSNALRYMLESSSGREGFGLIEALKEALTRLERFVERSQNRIEKVGEALFDATRPAVLMTHCNSQTAIGVIRRGWELGGVKKVFSMEARPRYQGRITSHQLASYGIETYMIVDSACNYFMDQVNMVVVGADTVFQDGDFVNKIGTSTLALVAKEWGVPLYSAASLLKMAPPGFSKKDLVIEMRPREEIAPPGEFPGVNILNPAFDLTPSSYITGYITERGILRPEEIEGHTFTSEAVKRLLED